MHLFLRQTQTKIGYEGGGEEWDIWWSVTVWLQRKLNQFVIQRKSETDLNVLLIQLYGVINEDFVIGHYLNHELYVMVQLSLTSSESVTYIK